MQSAHLLPDEQKPGLVNRLRHVFARTAAWVRRNPILAIAATGGIVAATVFTAGTLLGPAAFALGYNIIGVTGFIVGPCAVMWKTGTSMIDRSIKRGESSALAVFKAVCVSLLAGFTTVVGCVLVPPLAAVAGAAFFSAILGGVTVGLARALNDGYRRLFNKPARTALTSEEQEPGKRLDSGYRRILEGIKEKRENTSAITPPTTISSSTPTPHKDTLFAKTAQSKDDLDPSLNDETKVKPLPRRKSIG